MLDLGFYVFYVLLFIAVAVVSIFSHYLLAIKEPLNS